MTKEQAIRCYERGDLTDTQLHFYLNDINDEEVSL